MCTLWVWKSWKSKGKRLWWTAEMHILLQSVVEPNDVNFARSSVVNADRLNAFDLLMLYRCLHGLILCFSACQLILNMANFCRICFYYSRISWQCMTMILQKVLWHIKFWGRFPRLPKLTSMRHTKKIPGDFYANCSKYRCNLFHKAQPTTINFKPGLHVTYWSTQLETNASNIDFGRQSTYHFSLPEAPNQIWP